MADGTVKQVNPFSGVEVWSVPGRGNKPLGETDPNSLAHPISDEDRENTCAFCSGRFFETAPEKARVVLRDSGYTVLDRIPPEEYHSEAPLFRRVANLFEILSIDYWRHNYNYKLSQKNQRWRDSYLATEVGSRHVIDLIDYKLSRSGKSDEEIDRIPVEEKVLLADSLFGGSHDLIICEPHFGREAVTRDQLFSTGDLSDEEHYHYFLFTIDAMRDIVENNRYVRQVTVFKNWLRPAGATFDHLHTQLVAIDEWGEALEHKIRMINEDKNVYNTYGPNFAGHHNLVFCENEHAIAFVGVGHRYPTIEIYSKSVNARPADHTPDEVRGMSDVVRACHAAIGSNVSVNEEWYHTPVDSIFKMPWHVFIRLRINTPAGFEGGTNIFINPLLPTELRDRMVTRLYGLRSEGAIASGIRVAEECVLSPNCLQYYKST